MQVTAGSNGKAQLSPGSNGKAQHPPAPEPRAEAQRPQEPKPPALRELAQQAASRGEAFYVVPAGAARLGRATQILYNQARHYKTIVTHWRATS